MRTRKQMVELNVIAHEQIKTSKARDYWEGVSDAISYMLGEIPPAIEAWLIVKESKDARR